MTVVNDGMPDHILALLGSVMDGFRRDLLARTSEAGKSARGLRSSHIRLLSLTPAEGMRVTDLAERVGMTKQALGEFANALENQGLMESRPDPTDRRVRILGLTTRGRQAVVDATKLIDALESQWRRALGSDNWAQLREQLIRAAEYSQTVRKQEP